tara:strand:- start:2084 stop:2446 length:363 start_codon:yes stop_codon:yes gene_type:complete
VKLVFEVFQIVVKQLLHISTAEWMQTFFSIRSSKANSNRNYKNITTCRSSWQLAIDVKPNVIFHFAVGCGFPLARISASLSFGIKLKKRKQKKFFSFLNGNLELCEFCSQIEDDSWVFRS